MSFLDLSLLGQGGPVMWVLLGLSVVALVVFAERALYLHRGQIRSTAFLTGIKNILLKRRLMEAVTVCEETPGPVAAVVKAALLHHDADEAKLRLVVQEAALVEIPILERRMGALAAIAQVAPLLGLLGTVLGMLRSFHAFMQGGNYATPAALAGGMWEALLATAFGLAVAIPTHLAHHFLRGRVRVLAHDMEWAANEIIRFLGHELKGAAAPAVLAPTPVPGPVVAPASPISAVAPASAGGHKGKV
ncbi:MAG: MotA/TolQ/ExbB proton channel family protein [Opitutaceae bacterium]